MQAFDSDVLLPEYESQWQWVQGAILRNRLPQALLLVGSSKDALSSFVKKIASLRFCAEKSTVACGQCHHCKMIHRSEHPDIHWIKPDKAGSALKVEQIRQLQNLVYQHPRSAVSQLFILESAERMSPSVANALLKILEEPPESSAFILLAGHLSTLLPTIISRCQLLRFDDRIKKNNLLQADTLLLSGLEVEFIDSVMGDLVALLSRKTIPVLVAARWKDHEFKNVLNLLYLIFSQLIYLSVQSELATGRLSAHLNQLLTQLTPNVMLLQLSRITLLLQKINHNVNINQNLAIEGLCIQLVNTESR